MPLLPRDWLDRIEPLTLPMTWTATLPSTTVFTALHGEWVRAAEAVTNSFTVAGRALASAAIGRPDRGEEDQVSDVLDPAATAETYPEDNGPFRLTRATLQELGSCGPYVRTFSNVFPREQYPDGVEITEELCVQHYNNFDWSWAEGRLLNESGKRLYTQLVRSRSEENRRFGTGDRRRAAVFGHVFSTRPDLRHEDLATIRSAAARRADQDAIRDVQRTRSDIETYEREIDRYQRALESAREKLPLLEASAAGALRRVAATRVRELEIQHRRMLERAEHGLQAVRDAQVELERLTALEAEQEAKKIAEAVASVEATVEAPLEVNVVEGTQVINAEKISIVALDPVVSREPLVELRGSSSPF